MERLEDRVCLAAGTLAWGFSLEVPYSTAMATDAAGNTYIAGDVDGTFDFAPSPTKTVSLTSPPGDHMGYLAKYSSAGALVWVRSVGPADRTFFMGAMSIDRKTGDLLVGGGFDGVVDFGRRTPSGSSPGFTLTSSSSGDAFYLRIDRATGATKFAMKFDGRTGQDSVTDIDSDALGNVYLSGAFSHIVSQGQEDPDLHLTDAYVMKLNASNRWLWTRRYGNDTDWVGIGGLAVDRAGNVYAEGTNNGTTDFDPNSTIASRALTGEKEFLLKLNTNGAFVWLGRLDMTGGNEQPKISGITTDPSGNVIVSGHFGGTVDLNFSPRRRHNLTTHAWLTDGFVAKYNALGELQWARQIGHDPATATWEQHDDAMSGYGEKLKGVVTDSAGNIYVAGNLSGNTWFAPNGPKVTQSDYASRDRMVVKYSASGVFQKAVVLPGGDSDNFFFIASDAAGNLYLNGYFDYRLDIDPGARELYLQSREFDEFGDNDLFLVKLV
jgi:hypothetical protein